jgi:hypothetical protein
MTCVTASAGEEVIKDSQEMDCFVYTPYPVDAAKTYQLVVGVHGVRGKGNGAAGNGVKEMGDSFFAIHSCETVVRFQRSSARAA